MSAPSLAPQSSHLLARIIRPATLDRLEQIVIVTLFLWLAWRVLHSDNPLAPLLLVSELSVAVIVLFRRPTDAISLDLRDWGLAIAATALPMLVNPVELSSHVAIAVALMVAGNLWQIGAKLFLRRSFGVAPANRGVRADGPYRLMRHPIYAGYLVVHIGILLMMPSIWNAAVYAMAWACQIVRLIREEKFLSQDPAYLQYCAQVKYRLIPGIY